jgi:hypothetical protein
VDIGFKNIDTNINFHVILYLEGSIVIFDNLSISSNIGVIYMVILQGVVIWFVVSIVFSLALASLLSLTSSSEEELEAAQYAESTSRKSSKITRIA